MYCFVVVSVLCQNLGVRMFCNCSCVETFSLSPVHDLTDMSLFYFIFLLSEDFRVPGSRFGLSFGVDSNKMFKRTCVFQRTVQNSSFLMTKGK